MIHIHLTPESLNKTRLTYSPLVEVMMSYRLLRAADCAPEFAARIGQNPMPNATDVSPALNRWIESSQRALQDVSLPLMDSLMLTPKYVPDFITPTPDHFETDIECDLYELLHTPHEFVQKHLTDWGKFCDFIEPEAFWSSVASDPSDYLPRLTEEIRLYWSRAIAPHWSTLVAIAESDILFRARQMAMDGTHRLFNDLSKRAVFDGKSLHLDKKGYRNGDGHFVIDEEDGFSLVPSIFGGMALMWQVGSDYKPMLIYGARGVGTWQQRQPHLDESLELLLGSGRASVLQDLVAMPATTTELAHHLHLTASAVSQHLTILHRAGLVSPQRSGKRVYYQLSNKGSDLVRLFR